MMVKIKELSFWEGKYLQASLLELFNNPELSQTQKEYFAIFLAASVLIEDCEGVELQRREVRFGPVTISYLTPESIQAVIEKIGEQKLAEVVAEALKDNRFFSNPGLGVDRTTTQDKNLTKR